ncbi:MAG: hypothetical protein ACRYGK_06970 [Janthinobacterium lividum]
MNTTDNSKYSFQINRGMGEEQRGWQLSFFQDGKAVGKQLQAVHPADTYEMALQYAFDWLQQRATISEPAALVN